MVLYPTEQWLDEYRRLLNESTTLQDLAFDENLLLVITDLQLAETTIGDLPDSALAELPENVREGLSDLSLEEAVSLIDERVRRELPETIRELLEQTERDVYNGEIYVYIELEDGSCTDATLLDGPEDRDVDSIFKASARTWQDIVSGRPATSAVLSGGLEVIGNELLKLQHTAELQLICDIAADVETEFLFDHGDRSFVNFVLDESMRQPLIVQKAVTRQAALTMNAFTPF
jgi:putative sterol carrier protein